MMAATQSFSSIRQLGPFTFTGVLQWLRSAATPATLAIS